MKPAAATRRCLLPKCDAGAVFELTWNQDGQNRQSDRCAPHLAGLASTAVTVSTDDQVIVRLIP